MITGIMETFKLASDLSKYSRDLESGLEKARNIGGARELILPRYERILSKDADQLCTAEEWESLYPQLLVRSKVDDPKEEGRFPDFTAYFYAETGEPEKLLDLCRGYGARHIAKFHEYLLPEYWQDVLDMYIPYFEQKARILKQKNELSSILMAMSSVVLKSLRVWSLLTGYCREPGPVLSRMGQATDLSIGITIDRAPMEYSST